MAVLTHAQLNRMAKTLLGDVGWNTDIDFSGTQLDAVFQAIEDHYETVFKPAVAVAMNTAAGAKTFSNPELKKLGRAYLAIKFDLEA